MNVLKHTLLAVIVTLPLAAQAAVDVTFTNPEKYTDARPRDNSSKKDRDVLLGKLRAHLEKQSERYVKPGQDLKIEVLDVDLAGRFEWWHPGLRDVRIMRGIDSPAMKVRYSLTENGAVLTSGEESIKDLSYLMGVNAVATNTDPLRYEKAMLTDWLRKRFGASAS